MSNICLIFFYKTLFFHKNTRNIFLHTIPWVSMEKEWRHYAEFLMRKMNNASSVFYVENSHPLSQWAPSPDMDLSISSDRALQCGRSISKALLFFFFGIKFSSTFIVDSVTWYGLDTMVDFCCKLVTCHDKFLAVKKSVTSVITTKYEK